MIALFIIWGIVLIAWVIIIAFTIVFEKFDNFFHRKMGQVAFIIFAIGFVILALLNSLK